MSAPQPLQRLMAWLSPSFPTGAFAWSAGLETAIAERSVADAAMLQDWLLGALRHGGQRTDAILLAHAHRAAGNSAALSDLADLAIALTPARERLEETLAIGEAFVRAASAWPVPVTLPAPCPYPIAVGATAAAHRIGLLDTLLAFVSSQVMGQISVGVRLVPIGQSAGLGVLAALEPEVAHLAEAAATASLDDIGTIAYAADIAQMRHEALGVRIFKS